MVPGGHEFVAKGQEGVPVGRVHDAHPGYALGGVLELPRGDQPVGRGNDQDEAMLKVKKEEISHYSSRRSRLFHYPFAYLLARSRSAARFPLSP